MDLLSSLLKSVETGDRSILDSAIAEREDGFIDDMKVDLKAELAFHEKLSLLYLWLRYPTQTGKKINAENILGEFVKRAWKKDRLAAYSIYERLVEINNRGGADENS